MTLCGLIVTALPLSVQAYRPPDQRTMYDDWISDSQSKTAAAGRDKSLWAAPAVQEFKGDGIAARLERESREAWDAGERRLRERRAAREAAAEARAAEIRALGQLYDAARAGDADALMTLGERNSSRFTRFGLREYQRVYGPRRREALWRMIDIQRAHATDGLDEFRPVDSLLAELAGVGDAKAARQLADQRLGEEDFYQAGKYFTQAGEAGDKEAQTAVIRLVAEARIDAGLGEPETFYAWCRARAAQGDVAAQWIYAQALVLDRELKANPAEALAPLRKIAALDPAKLNAAEQAMRIKASALGGTLLLEGHGIPTDPEAGLTLLKTAADEEDVDAMLTLGRAYLVGRGVEADPGEALAWLENAVRKDSGEAAELLAAFYLQEDAAEFDEIAGIDWLRQAAKRRPKAMIEYGRILAAGEYGVARDQEEALAFFTLAIQRYPNDPDVLDFIGQSYVGGEYGLREKPAEGVRILKLAFARGSVRAAQRLESIYRTGATGVARDPTEATRWQERASAQN